MRGQSRKPLIVGKGIATLASTDGEPIITAAIDKSRLEHRVLTMLIVLLCYVDVIDLKGFVSGMGVRVISYFKVKPQLTDYQRTHNYLHNTFRLCVTRAEIGRAHV